MLYTTLFYALFIGGVACAPTTDTSNNCLDKTGRGCGGVCGDGQVQAPEQCDLGPKNGVSGSGCSADCKLVPVCGNGKVEDGEQCDLGPDNGKPRSGCSQDCKKTSVCGNGKVEAGEECDAGPDNGKPNSGCSKNCKKTSVCGNGKVEGSEECDLGPNNGKPGSGCSKECKKVSICGNGKVEPGEECDEGNKNGKPNSGCSKECKKVPVSKCHNCKKKRTPTTQCEMCNPNPSFNKCDITTLCINAPGNNFYCACRVGYRANGLLPTDQQQFRLEVPGQEYRVFVAPGIECDTLCTNSDPGPTWCQEVPVRSDC